MTKALACIYALLYAMNRPCHNLYGDVLTPHRDITGYEAYSQKREYTPSTQGSLQQEQHASSVIDQLFTLLEPPNLPRHLHYHVLFGPSQLSMCLHLFHHRASNARLCPYHLDADSLASQEELSRV